MSGEKLAKETAEHAGIEWKDDWQTKWKGNFSKAFATIDSLYAARSCLNDEVVDDLDRLLKKLDAITEGHVDQDGDELFDMADDLEHDIMTAQEHLEKIYEALSSITDCWSDPDEEYEEDWLSFSGMPMLSKRCDYFLHVSRHYPNLCGGTFWKSR